jgi:hypothetical protein
MHENKRKFTNFNAQKTALHQNSCLILSQHPVRLQFTGELGEYVHQEELESSENPVKALTY